MIPHDPFQTDDAAAPHEIVIRRFAAEAFEALKSRASAEIGGVIVASVPGGFMSSMERSRPPMITPAPVTIIDEFLQERTALGQYLIDVPIGGFHSVESGGDVGLGNILVKKVAHRIDKNHAGTLPLKRLRKAFWSKR